MQAVISMIRTVAWGGKLYGLPPDKENTALVTCLWSSCIDKRNPYGVIMVYYLVFFCSSKKEYEEGSFERTYFLWIKNNNYFQHCCKFKFCIISTLHLSTFHGVLSLSDMWMSILLHWLRRHFIIGSLGCLCPSCSKRHKLTYCKWLLVCGFEICAILKCQCSQHAHHLFCGILKRHAILLYSPCPALFTAFFFAQFEVSQW